MRVFTFCLAFFAFSAATFGQNLFVRSPVADQEIRLPDGLSPVLLSARLDNFFLFDQVKFIIDGQELGGINHQNGAFTAYYTPSSFGQKSVSVVSSQLGGMTETINLTFFLTQNTPQQTAIPVFQEVLTDKNISKIDTTVALPSHVGGFEKIILFVNADCPASACAPFTDAVSIRARTPEGDRIELVRYMTPIGKDCNFQIDVTDFFWALQGATELSIEHSTTENGLLWTMLLVYLPGPAPAKYGQIEPVWQGKYLFGDLANLQPVEEKKFSIPAGAASAKLKMAVTGHASGQNNSDNAAEFYHATHRITIDGQQKYDHEVWQTCVPNLEGCLPQNGNWNSDRAGWCPGMYVRWKDFDLADLIGGGPKAIRYRFDESYKDLCSPSNPACVSGVTCGWCLDPGAPNILIGSAICLFGNGPFGPFEVKTVAASEPFSMLDFELSPNPTDGNLLVSLPFSIKKGQINIFSASGKKMKNLALESILGKDEAQIEVADLPSGLYFLHLKTQNGTATRRFLKI